MSGKAGARRCTVGLRTCPLSLLTLQPFHPLVCPGPPPFFYVFFAADLDNYILRTNNNNIEHGHER